MAQKKLRIQIAVSTRGAQKSVGRLSKTMRNAGNLIRSSMAAVFRTAVVAGFFTAMRAGIQTIQKLKTSITQLSKEFAQLRLTATETAGIITGGSERFASVFQEAIDMSRSMANQIGRSAQEIQEGMVTAARSGLSLADSIEVTGSAMQLAVSNGAKFQDTLNDLIASTRAFGIELQNVPAFAEALTQAVRSSLTSLEGLFAGLKRVGAIASTAFGEGEQTFLDTASALMVMNDAGVQGQKAGTRLRSFMTKLVAQTTKVTSAFSKYNVNLFKANAASQQYLGTLLKASKATQETKDELNEVKDAQFSMMLAGKENTAQYQKLEDQSDKLNSKLGKLQKGMDDVFKQFRLSGGQLKDFSKVLNDMADSVPASVIAKVFGIRGGQAGTLLINNIEKFNKFKDSLEEVAEASREGESALGDIFAKFLQTAQIRALKLKNTLINIFGAIADPLLETFAPMMDPIQETLESIFKFVDSNKGLFEEVFVKTAEKLEPILEGLRDVIQSLLKQFRNLLTISAEGLSGGDVNVTKSLQGEGKSVRVPVLTTDAKGELSTAVREVSGTAAEKFEKVISAMGETLESAFQAAFHSLKEEQDFLASVFGTIFEKVLTVKMSLLESLGTRIGGAMAKGFFKAIVDAIPRLISAIHETLQKHIGIGTPVGKMLKFMGASNEESKERRAKEKEESRNKFLFGDKGEKGIDVGKKGIIDTPSFTVKGVKKFHRKRALVRGKTPSSLDASGAAERELRKIKDTPALTNKDAEAMLKQRMSGENVLTMDDLGKAKKAGNFMVMEGLSQSGTNMEQSMMKMESAAKNLSHSTNRANQKAKKINRSTDKEKRKLR